MLIVRHFIEAIVNPFFIILCLLLISTTGLLFVKSQNHARYGISAGLIALTLLSTGWVPMLITEIFERQYPKIIKASPDIHWVVVLGGGQAQFAEGEAYDLLSTASLRRLFEGVRLYRQLPQAKLVLSGGECCHKPPEAMRLADIASTLNLPPKQLVIEAASVNTVSQAKALVPLLQDKPFYLVTSAIHMPRAMALFCRQGLHPIAAPADFTYYWQDERWEKYYLPNPKNLVYFNIAWHEILGIAWAKLQGNASVGVALTDFIKTRPRG